MSLQTIRKDAVPDWVEQFCARYRIIVPQQKQAHTIFADIQEAEEINLDHSITLLPPKKVLLPPHEELFMLGTMISRLSRCLKTTRPSFRCPHLRLTRYRLARPRFQR